MKNILLILLFPLMMFAQDTTLVGDVDCSGEVTSQDASLILQFVTGVIDELPCQENMAGLTPEQLQEIINMMDEQLSINYSGDSSSNYPIMVSSVSSETMTWGDALIYCDGLEEDDCDDWFLPNLDQLAYVVSGGCELPDDRINGFLWTTSKSHSNTNEIVVLNESGLGGMDDATGYNALFNCRCVRFGEGETSEETSSSSGSNSSIWDTSEQPINMIGPVFTNTDFPDFTNHYTEVYGEDNYLNYIDAVAFCGQLNYNGYSDWVLPTYGQIQHYVEQQGQSNIVFANEFEFVQEEFWVKLSSDWELYNANVRALTLSISGDSYGYPNVTNTLLAVYSENIDSPFAGRRCFCVR